MVPVSLFNFFYFSSSVLLFSSKISKRIVLAKFFIIGFLPRLIARIFHLLGVFGFQSPFAYLPNSGLQSFLNNHVVIQSAGLFIVAIIMSLVLAKRTKFCKMS